jgi:protein-S-isoprenylcysteine O-methyltransferase Ste14
MRWFWILFGVGTHLLFAVAVVRLVSFLYATGPGTWAGLGAWLPWWAVDAFLAVQFGFIHSGLLLPRTRQRLQPVIPSPQYGCFFCAVTCLSLLMAIELWQPASPVLWRLTGVGGGFMTGAVVVAWATLLYSLSLTGLGYQTGWTPWWAWVCGRRHVRGWAEPGGAYRLLRHPVYLSFLALVWLTPLMTADRLLLGTVWTGYIFVGSHLKDRRLIHYVGDAYRRYQARVPGYFFIPAGPLARVTFSAGAESRRAA